MAETQPAQVGIEFDIASLKPHEWASFSEAEDVSVNRDASQIVITRPDDGSTVLFNAVGDDGFDSTLTPFLKTKEDVDLAAKRARVVQAVSLASRFTHLSLLPELKSLPEVRDEVGDFDYLDLNRLINEDDALSVSILSPDHFMSAARLGGFVERTVDDPSDVTGTATLAGPAAVIKTRFSNPGLQPYTAFLGGVYLNQDVEHKG